MRQELISSIEFLARRISTVILRLHRINFVDARNLLRKRAKAGEKKAALVREFAISRETLYQYLGA
jgi:hypothetical protein